VKKFIYLVAFSMLLAISHVNALDVTMTDLFSTGNDGSGGPLLRIDSTGGILNVGANTLSGATTFDDGIPMVYTIVAPAATNQTVLMNHAFEPNAMMTAGSTSYTLANGDYINPAIPRNLVIISSATGAGDSDATFLGTIVATGYDAKHQAVTESITISTNTTLYGTGNVAWSSVTSLAMVPVSTGDVSIAFFNLQVGVGDKFGIPADLQEAGDLYHATEADVSTASADYTLDLTYDTYLPNDVADGTDSYSLFYLYKKR
jgi:hypothetical protein